MTKSSRCFACARRTLERKRERSSKHGSRARSPTFAGNQLAVASETDAHAPRRGHAARKREMDCERDTYHCTLARDETETAEREERMCGATTRP